jgi:NADPH2:quinone reductase
MNAIQVHQFGEPSVLQLEEAPDPTPGPGQVVVRIRAAGVNPVDTYIRSGAYARLPELPFTPGTDGAGLVEAIGPGVKHVAPGDRVYVARTSDFRRGTYAELTVCDTNQVYPLPSHVSFAQGAGVNVPYATAYRALFGRAAALPGETVLVHGASGGVGTAAVQIARAHGMQVIGTAGSERGLQLARGQGAHHVLNHREPGYLQQVMALTGDRGADVVLEMLANVNLNNDLSVLALRGRIVVVGNRGTIEIDPRRAMARDAAVLGMTYWNTPPDEFVRIHAALVAGLENRTLTPIVGRELPLADAADAHQAVLKPGAYGKIVLLP